MQLDSKESDIEQLREKLNDLQLRMDNSSVTSLQTDETDSNLAGRITTTAAATFTAHKKLRSHMQDCYLETIKSLNSPGIAQKDVQYWRESYSKQQNNENSFMSFEMLVFVYCFRYVTPCGCKK